MADPREALADRLTQDNPKSRRHHEEYADGRSSWTCIPLRDAVEVREELRALAARQDEPSPALREAVKRAVSILAHTSDHHATDARLMLVGALAGTREAAPRMPTVDEFRRMGPERTAEWHRQSGIAARVEQAMSEAEEGAAAIEFLAEAMATVRWPIAMTEGGTREVGLHTALGMDWDLVEIAGDLLRRQRYLLDSLRGRGS